MAKLFVSPEFLMQVLLPDVDATIVAVGFSGSGRLVLDLVGPAVPVGAAEVTVELHTTVVDGERLKHSAELKAVAH